MSTRRTATVPPLAAKSGACPSGVWGCLCPGGEDCTHLCGCAVGWGPTVRQSRPLRCVSEEPRVLGLLGKCSTPWATPQSQVFFPVWRELTAPRRTGSPYSTPYLLEALTESLRAEGSVTLDWTPPTSYLQEGGQIRG